MPNTHILDLPFDIVERLLLYFPDYDCLWSFVASGKILYDLFNSRRDYFMNAIGENQFGQSLYYARYLSRLATLDALDKKDMDLGTASLPNSILSRVDAHWMEQPPILFSEGRILNEIARVVKAWEAHYSNLYKQRTVASSTLTSQESFRFTRALCRIWAFINYWHHDQMPRSDPPFQYSYNLVTYGTIILGMEEACELRDVWIFLSEVVGWLNACNGYDDMKPRRIVVFNQTPKELLRCFTEQDPMWPNRTVTARAESASTVLTSVCRAYNILDDTFAQARPILSTRSESSQECVDCHSTKADIWEQNNFYWLRGCLPPQRLVECLSLDRTTAMDVRDHLHRPHSYSQFFNEMRDVAQKDLTGGSGTLVQRMCTDCVKALAKAHIRSWISTYLRSAKQKEKIAENAQSSAKDTADEDRKTSPRVNSSVIAGKGKNGKKLASKSRDPHSFRKLKRLSSPRRKTVSLPVTSASNSDSSLGCAKDFPFTFKLTIPLS